MIRSANNHPFDDDGPALRHDEQMRDKSVYDFDPFNNGLLAGQSYHGPVGDLHYQARHFDPTTGVWLTDEPIEAGDMMNVCRYVSNQPAAASDPSQNMPTTESTV
jgi:RHS repeat-associated protein